MVRRLRPGFSQHPATPANAKGTTSALFALVGIKESQSTLVRRLRPGFSQNKKNLTINYCIFIAVMIYFSYIKTQRKLL